jgi:hypothetical protein
MKCKKNLDCPRIAMCRAKESCGVEKNKLGRAANGGDVEI